ncbi:hypothetical protein IV494_02325 [Kaistella sp. G5-32]|uniref:HTH cro/C1-type domain-containing protein n=1 Tax=Kaistella gelatinilytica TaxID=2787636 RepID=A0ABS0F8H5_9FLAO|nr:helix-turn-helix transcriptional regulator [Kaistella gelatinilytica]MBF8456005.1 hypothetical protein [Kaistella gelatinilytica]
MGTNRTYLQQGIHPYPHIGNLIRQKLKELNITSTEAARRLGVNSTNMHAYYKNPSLQFGIIWKLSIAINYDLLSDIMDHYPENFPKKIDPRIAEMEKELEIYKSLLRR